MSQAEIQAGLIADLARLARDGSGSEVLDACTTLLSLRPVSLAIEGGALAAVAARTLLATVAQRAVTTQTYVRAAAALTGIDPPDANRGVKGEPRLQRLERAGSILGGIEARTVRNEQKQQRCYQEYAEAVLDFLRTTSRDPGLMKTFLIQCGVSEHDTAPRPEHLSPSGWVDGAERLYARQIPLSGAVRQALDAACTSCEARGRAFYTPDLLLALLDMPRSRTSDCLEQVAPGLARDVREWLNRQVSEMNTGHADPFQPFEWVERPDVQVAQDLVALDGSAVVTEIYLLLGVLGSESDTRRRLADHLGPAYDHLAEVVNARRHQPPRILKTPGPR